MDGQRFDRLSRTLASTSGRRGFIRLVAGAFMGAGVAAKSATAALACLDGQIALRDGCVCKATMRPPVNGVCPCGAGQTDCAGTCKDLSSDLANCGACGNACPDPTPGTCQGPSICRAGACWVLPLPAGTVCRPAAGDCDIPETCDGISLDCPPDAFAPSTQLCRDIAGACDQPEYCSGNGPQCPPDVLKPANTVCRAGDGPCNPREVCDGTSPQCPPDSGVIGGEACGSACCAPPQRCVLTTHGQLCGAGGGLGQACRASDPPCDAGMSCDPDTITCQPCGENGNRCCGAPFSGTCQPGFVCHYELHNPFDQRCRPCGGDGEFCCGTGTCEGDLTCVPIPLTDFGTCHQCGGSGQACCLPDHSCDAGFQCDLDVCKPCGAYQDRCCAPDFSCSSDLSCTGIGQCLTRAECGGFEQPCCDSSPANIGSCDSPNLTCTFTTNVPGGALGGLFCL